MNRKKFDDRIESGETSSFSVGLTEAMDDAAKEAGHSQFSTTRILLFTLGFAGGMAIFQAVPWLQGIRFSTDSNQEFSGFEVCGFVLLAIVLGLALSALHRSGWRSNVGKRLAICVGISLLAFWFAEILATLYFTLTGETRFWYTNFGKLAFRLV